MYHVPHLFTLFDPSSLWIIINFNDAMAYNAAWHAACHFLLVWIRRVGSLKAKEGILERGHSTIDEKGGTERNSYEVEVGKRIARIYTKFTTSTQEMDKRQDGEGEISPSLTVTVPTRGPYRTYRKSRRCRSLKMQSVEIGSAVQYDYFSGPYHTLDPNARMAGTI